MSDRDVKIASLNEYCEACGFCDHCVIGGIPNLKRMCVDTPFENMSTDELDFLFEFAKEAKEVEVTENDPVNHPSHYTSGGIECLAALEASMTPIEYAGFLKGQVFKYIWRYRLKGKPLEDLKKARFYLDRLIQSVENEEVEV